MHEHDFEEQAQQQTTIAEPPAPAHDAHAAHAARLAPAGNRAMAGALQRKEAPGKEEQKPGEPEGGAELMYPGRFRDDQYGEALGEITELVTSVPGIAGRQQQTLEQFCEMLDKKDPPPLSEELLKAAVLGGVTLLTDGMGTAIAAAAMKGAGPALTAITKATASPGGKKAAAATTAWMTEQTKKLVDSAVGKTKDLAKDQAGKAIDSALSTKGAGGASGGRYSDPIQAFRAAQTASINVRALAFSRSLRAELLHAPTTPPKAKWAMAQAISDAMRTALTTIVDQQLNAASDAWFAAQRTSGRGTLAGKDFGTAAFSLGRAGPRDGLKLTGGYIAGDGANAQTMKLYEDRKLEDIKLDRIIEMDNGSLGKGIAPVWFKLRVDEEGQKIEFKELTRWGYAWLAAKALNLPDLDSDDPRITQATIGAGARAVWHEIEGHTTKGDGATFEVNTALFSGPAGW